MNDESLRAKIRNMSKELNISSHLLLQNYLLERLLYRISISGYKENLVLKGGLLIASLIGVDRRTTMDMDTSIKAYPVNKEQIVNLLLDVISIEGNDGISFDFVDIKEIRQEDKYQGFRARLTSNFGKISQNVSIDISTGDVITPGQIAYSYKMLVDEGTIDIRSYNIESVLAEKIETIISRGVLNTRMRDLYDVHMLVRMRSDAINQDVLRNAITRTFQNRGSYELLKFWADIIGQIEESQIVSDLWGRYLVKNPHIDDLSFDEVIASMKELLEKVI